MSTPIRETYHHGQLRPALIREARALLDAGGPEAVSLREAARRAGVSATATYRHFADKDALLAAVAAEGFQAFAAALGEAARGPDGFAGMGRAYVAFALAHPGLFRLMFGPLLAERAAHRELDEAADLAFAGLQGAAAAERGVSAEAAEATALAAWSLVHGLAHLFLDGILPRDEAEEIVARVLSDGAL